MRDRKLPWLRNSAAVLGRETGFIIACFLIFISMAWTMVIIGQRQFGSNDMSVLIDEAYRLYLGQRPYADFPTMHPVLFYLGSLWAFQMFGVAWSAFVYITVLFSGLTFALQTIMLRRIGISRGWTITIALAVQLATLFPASYWWYNPCGAMVVCLLCTAAPLALRKPDSHLNWVLYAISLFAASLGKPNSAGIVIMACAVAILLHKETRVKGLLYSLAAACCSLALLAVYHLNPVVIVGYYLSGAGRGIPSWERFVTLQVLFMVFWQLATLMVVVTPIVALLARRIFADKPWTVDIPSTIVLSAGIVAGLIACFTNGDTKLTDTSMVMTCTSLLYLFTIAGKDDPSLHLPLYLQRFAIVASILIAVWTGITRYRVQMAGPFYDPDANITITTGNAFFSGLTCGPIMIHILKDTGDFLAVARRNFKGESNLLLDPGPGHAVLTVKTEPKIFFGYDMNFAYAAFNCEPPRGLPYGWYAGDEYPIDQFPAIAANFKRARFDYLVFCAPNGKGLNIGYMPIELLRMVLSDYYQFETTQDITVFARKGQ